MLVSALLVVASFAGAQGVPEDARFLRTLAGDTWRCIADLSHPVTGLPYDDSSKGEYTSVSNIGLYLSSVVAAKKLGLVKQAEVDQRLDKALDSLEKLETSHGFQQSWNSVETLRPAKHDPWVSVLDSGNLAAGLLTVASAEPKLSARCRKLFEAMDWGSFYDKEQKALLGGLNRETGQLNREWRLAMLGTDALLAQFFVIASGGAPPTLWDSLDRSMEKRHGLEYLKPGWEGGGLFMQFISGIWLDNAGTLVGRSSKAFAEAQMRHAKEIGVEAWGWSASAAPDGSYLGWGALKDEVVTPHASVLAIEFFPKEVVGNLRALEKLGCRSPDLGYYDAIDVRSRKVARKFLVLDQAMILLSLANHLEGGAVRRWFQSDPTVRKGRGLIAEYAAK